MNMEIMHKDDLPLGGFAGLTEKRLVVDGRLWDGPEKSWGGLGNFVYLADANFLPKGQTNMHSHREVDVISLMVDGRIVHEGSLEHGTSLETNEVQVQRAGGEGFSHNEVNPDDVANRMIQMWVLPETPGEPAGYKSYDLNLGKVTRIYGGAAGQTDTFPSKTVLEVARLENGQQVPCSGEALAYVAGGVALVGGERISDGHLVRGIDLEFKALEDDTKIIIITTH